MNFVIALTNECMYITCRIEYRGAGGAPPIQRELAPPNALFATEVEVLRYEQNELFRVRIKQLEQRSSCLPGRKFVLY